MQDLLETTSPTHFNPLQTIQTTFQKKEFTPDTKSGQKNVLGLQKTLEYIAKNSSRNKIFLFERRRNRTF
jgi:hypothetical protein